MSALIRATIFLLLLVWFAQTPTTPAQELPEHSRADESVLEHLRLTGNLAEQRAHLWMVLGSITRSDAKNHGPAFTGWFNKSEAFAAGERVAFPGQPAAAVASAMAGGVVRLDAPVITFVHFNAAAYQHIRTQRLFDAATLEKLRHAGPRDVRIPSLRSIPPWPRDAVTIMSAWWPVAERGTTPLPVWDPSARKRLSGSNSYVNWPRVVAIDPLLRGSATQAASVEFAGRSFKHVRRVGLSSFFHLAVDEATASRLMSDESSRKAAVIALGRSLQAGDTLVLVALHVMTAELPSGIWGTFWWHDVPDVGQFAVGRPATLTGPWRHLLMDVAFDAVLPREPDGSPRVCFNPWFDAPFPGSAHANGLHSNCVNCHNRASYPAVSFLPIRRGEADLLSDPAYAPGQLRTGQVWSVAHPAAIP